MGTTKIAEKRWAYTLYKLSDGSIVLSVLCGGAAMFELNIPLDAEDAEKAVLDEKFVEEYASSIRTNPERYAHRSISI